MQVNVVGCGGVSTPLHGSCSTLPVSNAESVAICPINSVLVELGTENVQRAHPGFSQTYRTGPRVLLQSACKSMITATATFKCNRTVSEPQFTSGIITRGIVIGTYSGYVEVFHEVCTLGSEPSEWRATGRATIGDGKPVASIAVSGDGSIIAAASFYSSSKDEGHLQD